ncbi:Acyl-CoA dehydrogenase [Colletotrichum sp. SAR 10_70]|nr:Acyl-CoA dehydrogenase [Colletotrichum sp. SAR 10_71]KAI8174809.1 Acyl-CoA dehydrogenase [Colletotrichum sp. SAR 10_70]KAI8211003.1 Acyl-CoA dehydrogenase [Colletotrichum sp. SAR 10_76]KAI8229980.1 Acyl-CoA dehydrogenase [Colletotrichum sp. SAR 10_86]KAI8251867.1 Acyl-CoA dehydrogenase [Colletotrichum sp. SAR 10_77]
MSANHTGSPKPVLPNKGRTAVGTLAPYCPEPPPFSTSVPKLTSKPEIAYVRDFVDTHLLPYAQEWEAAGECPLAARLQFAKSGLAFLDVPREYRPRELMTIAGIPFDELDVFHELILMDEMARIPSGVPLALAGASNVGAPPVWTAGTEEQKRRWLPGLFTWETSFCLAITEPTAGSDVSAIRATAEKTADGRFYVVNGRKKWVTGAPWATHMTTAVRMGITIRKIHNSGHNAGGSSWVILENVKVPVDHLLGKENGAFPIIMRNFNKERFILTVDCNRQARICLTEALQHAHDRETFGKPLASHQIIRHKLTTIAREVEGHWAWLEQIAYHVKIHGWQTKDVASRIALAKIQGGRMVEQAVRESQQIHGGMGFEKGVTMTEQISRDLRLKVIGGGSEEILSDLAWREEHKRASGLGAKL